MSERTVAVFGSTGTQGASVIDALLADGTFKPRAITRDPSSNSSLALKERGCEIAQCEQWDLESLKRVMLGCECVFGMTYFHAPTLHGPDDEARHGKLLVDAAKESGVHFFVWSSSPNAAKPSGGKYTNVHHHENKMIVEEYLKQSGLANASVHTGFFAENLWKYDFLSKAEAGYTLGAPILKEDTRVYFSWIGHDLGPSVLALLKNYQSHDTDIIGQTFHALTTKTSFGNFAKILEQAFGVPVKYVTLPRTGIKVFDEVFEMLDEADIFPDIVVPDPRLMKLGVKFGSLEDFAEAVKTKYV